jgi:DNA-binding NarL/FixJ family response regulator
MTLAKPRVLLVSAQGEAGDLAGRLQGNPHIDFVGRAEGLEQATDSLREAKPDVMLLDIHRWNGSAIDFCREVRRATGIPLAVLASSMTPERWRNLEEAGATELLLKHVDTGQLGRELVRLAAVNHPALGGDHKEETT